jgi:hypothetical protein
MRWAILVSTVILASMRAFAATSAAVEPVYEVGRDVKAPVRIKSCDPVIPKWVQKQRITQPMFIYEAVISSRGEVRSVRLTNPEPAKEPYVTIEHAFHEAIKCWRFRAAIRKGKPVACRYMLTATVEVR